MSSEIPFILGQKRKGQGHEPQITGVCLPLCLSGYQYYIL